MDGRNPHDVIPYISSLDSTTNGACPSWTAMLSMDGVAIHR